MKAHLTFTDHSDRVLRGWRMAIVDALYIAADETAGYIKQGLLRGPKTGKTYTKTNPNRTHRASAAGEYPATDLGVLQNSVGPERDQSAAYIVSTAKYAVDLEMRPSSRGGRPFITRGVIENGDRIGEIVTRYMERMTNG